MSALHPLLQQAFPALGRIDDLDGLRARVEFQS